MRRRSNSGFTLVEALVAVVIVAIGVVGSLAAFGKLSQAEVKANQSELMQRLALDKYDEMIATAPTQITSASGDFSDRNMPNYTWNMTVNTTDTQDLNSVIVAVSRSDQPTLKPATVYGLFFQSTQQSSGNGTPTAGAGGP